MKITTDRGLRLYYKNQLVFEHTSENSFISAVDWKVKFKSSHGNFNVSDKIKDKTDLVSYTINGKSDNKAIITFTSGTVHMKVTVIETENCLKMIFGTASEKSFMFNLAATKNEGIFGGGEQFRQLNMKGEKVKNCVSEHIVVKPIAEKTVFSFLPYKVKSHSEIETYAPMTCFTSSEKYAIRFDTNSYGVSDFSRENISSFLFESCPKSLSFFKEDTFLQLSKALAKDIPNKQYLPDWCYDGMILGIQGGGEIVEKKALAMLQKGAKICGVWCQDWSGQKVTAAGKQVYWNWIADEERYPDFKNYVARLEKKGIHFLAYINPYLVVDSTLYNYCKEKNMLIKKVDGSIYHIKSTTFDAGMMDLTNPEMVTYLKDVIIKKNMIDMGVKGYMADFGEYLPIDCVLHKGDALELHNYWPVLWAKINREAIEEAGKENEVMFFTRSAYNSQQQYAPIMWNGDQHTDTSIDYGMPCVMPASFNLGFSGLTAVHSDIAGFISFMSLARDSELFIRWMEMSTFSPLMRSHETIRPDFNAQYDADDVAEHTVYLTNVHEKLKPYIVKCLEDASKGILTIAPDFYYANDFSLHKDLYSYFFGEDIFVCPIIEKGAQKRKVNLPQGTWVHFVTKKEYQGMKEYTVDAPLGKPTAFFRKDSQYSDIFMSI